MGFQGFGDIYLSASSQHPVGNDLSYGRKDSIALGLSHTTPHDKRFKEDDLLPAVEVTKPKNVARTRTKSESSRKPREKSKPAGTLQWVNISHPDGTSDPAIRKLVKRHARLVSHRGSKKVQSKPVARPSTPPSGGTVPFYGTGNFTIPVDSRSQFLFQHYLLVIVPLWYPLENHVKYYRTLEKIDMSVVMGDEFLFRSLLLSSATILNRAEGSTEISSMAVPVLCTLNKRICDQPVPTNSTISIIIVLAVLEVITGNFTRWKHHICAATEMFRLRGGLTNITVCLKEKLTRAVMEGAGSSTEPIQLPTPVRSSRPLHEILPIEDLPLPEESILNSLHCTNMSIRLRSTLYDLDRLTQALSYTNSHPEMVIDAFRFEEDLIQIQYDLLGELNQFHSNPITGKQSAAIPTSMLLDEPVNLAALLYMRSFIWALRPPMRNRPIFPRLASALSRITKELTREVQDQAHVQPFFFCLSPLLTYMLPLLLWMHFLGGMCSFGDDANLFADGLLDLLAITPKKTLIENGCESWKEVKKMLSRVLWFPSIHDEVGQEFWGMVIDRAMATHDTIYGKEIGLANSND